MVAMKPYENVTAGKFKLRLLEKESALFRSGAIGLNKSFERQLELSDDKGNKFNLDVVFSNINIGTIITTSDNELLVEFNADAKYGKLERVGTE